MPSKSPIKGDFALSISSSAAATSFETISPFDSISVNTGVVVAVEKATVSL